MDTADLKTPEMILIHEILVLFFRLASTKRQYKLISNEAICRTTEAQHSHNKSCNLHNFCASGNGFFKAANSVRGLRLEMDKCILREQTQNFKLLLEAREELVCRFAFVPVLQNTMKSTLYFLLISINITGTCPDFR